MVEACLLWYPFFDHNSDHSQILPLVISCRPPMFPDISVSLIFPLHILCSPGKLKYDQTLSNAVKRGLERF
jgi:hypothetical protein